MQPLVEPCRDHLSETQVRSLIRDSSALILGGGMERLDLSLNVLEDISADLLGGSVARQSYATLHGTGTFRLLRRLDWGAAIVRPYITMSNGVIGARFNLGAYSTATPAEPIGVEPRTYEVGAYDILLRLGQKVGASYAIGVGESYLAKAEEIFTGRGYTRYVIDQSAAGTLATTARVWPIDTNTTWLTIVNELAGAVGYQGVWSDWDGQLRLQPYQSPRDRFAEWVYDDDIDTVMFGPNRLIERDFFDSPNRWVVMQSGQIDSGAPIEGAGIYTYVNDSVGDTSVAARGGLVVTRFEQVDASSQAVLEARAQSMIDADMSVPTRIKVSLPAPNPLHWHFDRIQYNDVAAGPIREVVCTSWTMPIPNDKGDMALEWSDLG